MNLQTIATTLSEANQTAVPSQIRQLLSLKPGDRLIWQTNPTSNQVTLKPLPLKLGKYLRGLGKEIWAKANATQYVKNLRQDRL